MAVRRVCIGLGIIGMCLAVLVTVLVVQRLNPDDFSGDPDDIASVKVAVPKLLVADTAVGRLPADPARPTRNVVFSKKSIAKRAAALREVWAPESVSKAIKDWEGAMTTVFHGERLYDDNRFDITKWLGVRVHGRTAVVDFRGHAVYHDAVSAWGDDQTLHHRVTLWRTSPESRRWYLVEHHRDVDNEYRVMGELTVGAAD